MARDVLYHCATGARARIKGGRPEEENCSSGVGLIYISFLNRQNVGHGRNTKGETEGSGGSRKGQEGLGQTKGGGGVGRGRAVAGGQWEKRGRGEALRWELAQGTKVRLRVNARITRKHAC